MGDLVPDRRALRPDFDPVRAAPSTAEHWHHVHEHTGMPWPVRLRWTPTSSGVVARAVKAAERQGDAAAGALLRALRESCFIFASPADDAGRVAEVARWVAGFDGGGLDPERLMADIDSADVESAFHADRAETRAPNEYVRTLQETHEGKGNAKPDGDGWRYVFPTLLFRGPDTGGEHTVPGWQPFERYLAAMEAAVPGSTAGGRPAPTPEQAVEQWPILADRELAVICGPGAAPPAGATPYDWDAGQAWLRKGVEPYPARR